MKTTATPTIKNITLKQKAWTVFLFDCNCHTYMEAIEQIVLAIACTEYTASHYADTAQKFGQVAIFSGTKDECEKVASILGSTGLKVAVTN